MSERGVHVHLAALWRRRYAIVITTGVGSLLAYWVAMALPNYFQSSVAISVAVREIDRRLVEVAAAPFDLAAHLQATTPRVLGSERLSELIEELRLYRPSQAPGAPAEAAVARMRSRIRVVREAADAARASELSSAEGFHVSFSHRDPLLAAQAADRLAEAFVLAYVDEQMALGRERLAALESELSRQSELHRAAEAEIARFRTANAGSLPEERATNQRLLEQSLDELRRAQRARDRARSDRAFWEAELASAATVSGEATELERRLEQLELQVADFRARGFTARHPGLIRAERELRALREERASNGGTSGSSRHAGDPRQSVEARRRLAEQELEASSAEVVRLMAQVGRLEERLAATADVAARLGALREESSRIDAALAKLADRHLQAKLQVDVERARLAEEFRIVEPARPAGAPSSPKRLQILAVGLALGLLLGVAVAVTAEIRDESFYSLRDLRSALSIPVLASIPDILVEEERIARRRRGLRNAIAASLIAAIGLAGGVVAYVYVNGPPGWVRAKAELRPSGEWTRPERSDSKVAQPAGRDARRARSA